MEKIDIELVPAPMDLTLADHEGRNGHRTQHRTAVNAQRDARGGLSDGSAD